MELKLKGELIPDDWAELYRYFGYTTGFYCPGDVQAAIDGLEPGEELLILLGSVGGDVDAAAEIYAMLQSCKHPVRVRITSMAASAASYFPMSADVVEMVLPAQMMIHCAAWDIGGNKREHRWAADQLETTDNAILDVYCARCGEDRREELRAMMEAETYLTARQCLELGLIDAIVGEEQSPSGEPLALVASVANNITRAMSVLPDIRTLRAERDAEQKIQRALMELEQYKL